MNESENGHRKDDGNQSHEEKTSKKEIQKKKKKKKKKGRNIINYHYHCRGTLDSNHVDTSRYSLSLSHTSYSVYDEQGKSVPVEDYSRFYSACNLGQSRGSFAFLQQLGKMQSYLKSNVDVLLTIIEMHVREIVMSMSDEYEYDGLISFISHHYLPIDRPYDEYCSLFVRSTEYNGNKVYGDRIRAYPSVPF